MYFSLSPNYNTHKITNYKLQYTQKEHYIPLKFAIKHSALITASDVPSLGLVIKFSIAERTL